MYERDSCASCPLPLAETECDVQTDSNKGEENRERRSHSHILSDCRTNLLCRDNTVLVILCTTETIESDIVAIEALQCIVEDSLYLLGSSLRSVIVLILSNDTHLVLATVLLNLNRRLCSVCINKRLSQSLTNLLCRNLLVETNYEGTATRKLNTVVQAMEHERSNTCQDNDTRSNISELTLADKIELHIAKQVI